MKVNISFFFTIVSCATLSVNEAHAQDRFAEAVRDLQNISTDSMLIVKSFDSIPEHILNIFIKKLPNKGKKPFVERKDAAKPANRFPKHARILQLAGQYKDYWIIVYRIHYGRYSDAATALMHMNNRDLDFILFMPIYLSVQELPKITQYLREDRNDFRRVGLKKYKYKKQSY